MKVLTIDIRTRITASTIRFSKKEFGEVTPDQAVNIIKHFLKEENLGIVSRLLMRRHDMSGRCKRGTVYAMGVPLSPNADIQFATNYNETECTGEAGKCGCIHAEIALLNKMIVPYDIVILSISPCVECAKALIAAGVSCVAYLDEYCITDGIKLLEEADVTCIHLGAMKYINPQLSSKQIVGKAHTEIIADDPMQGDYAERIAELMKGKREGGYA